MGKTSQRNRFLRAPLRGLAAGRRFFGRFFFRGEIRLPERGGNEPYKSKPCDLAPTEHQQEKGSEMQSEKQLLPI